MAVTYGFFNSVNGDRKYNADQMSEYFRGIVSQGVFQHLDSGLAVSAGTGLSVSVAAGRAIIQDRWIQNSAALNLTILAASETYGRKDAVVIRLDKSSRAISITVKTGTPAASPVAPSMTRNATTYEMALAYVNVAAGASSVTVTDKRSDSSVCGWAAVAQATSGEVDQMLNAMKTGFDGVEYGSPAAMVQGEDQNLQNQINGITDQIEIKNAFTFDGFINGSGELTSNSSYYATDYIQILNNGFYVPIKYTLKVFKNTKIGMYDKNKNFIAAISPSSSNSLEIVTNVLPYVMGAVYARFCSAHNESYTGFKLEYQFTKQQYIDPLTVVDAAFTFNGFIDNNGALAPHANYRSTDYIKVTDKGSFLPIFYHLRMFNNTKIGLYDSEKTKIGIISPSTSDSLEEVEGVVEYIDDLVYVRFCTAITFNYHDFMLKYTSLRNEVVSGGGSSSDKTFCNYDGNELSMFRKGLCIGDSLTEGTLNYYQDGSTAHYTSVEGVSYPTYLQKLTNVTITNEGHSGYTSVNWWNQRKNVDLSGHDFAIIQLGVNDVGQYGGWDSDVEAAFTNIINKLKTENKKIKIFVANIIPALSYSSEGYLQMSEDISDFVTGLADPQVILLDIQQYGHTRDSEAYNCGHLSAYGYWRLAQDYKNYIGYYINTHKMQFREVQFIGSDYYYTPTT